MIKVRFGSGLTARLGLATGLAAIVVVLVFAILSAAISNLNRQTNERRDAQRVTLAGDALQKSVLDLETGQRAFLITRREEFLEPWKAARARLPEEQRRLLARVASASGSGGGAFALARRIGRRIDGYVGGHSVPLVRDARRGRLDRQAMVVRVAEGKQRVDELRGLFRRLLFRGAARTEEQQAAADRAGTRAIGLGVGGVILILTVLGGGVAYLARTVTRPAVRVAEAASALAGGRLEKHERVSRRNTRAAREVQVLTESFDAMAEVVRDQRERLQAHNVLLERRVSERTAELEQARYEALLMLAIAAEHRDDDTHQHTQRVGRNAGLVAERLGLGEESIELIRIAAPLHDVGKIGISDSILLKPGRLTAEEFQAMKQHVRIGASILGSSSEPVFHIASQIGLAHHERWDGGGYLEGLAGEQIPLAGRIVAVVDVFDALTHSRPYKGAWPIDRALDEIRRGAGSQFDPDVVAAFQTIGPGPLLAEMSSDVPLVKHGTTP